MSRVTAVIVTYNSEDVIRPAVDSCVAAGLDVLVIDNASTDRTIARVPNNPAVRILRNRENRGFAAAVNQGFAAASTPLVLLLNPDAELAGGLDSLIDACAVPPTAAAAGKLVDAAGAWQRGFSIRRFPTAATLAFEVLGINRLFPSNPLNRAYRYLDWPENRAGFVDQPAGAFLLVRRDAWQAAGGFDERFHPVWFEDVDFCLRLHHHGYRIRYEPRAVARHRGGHSAARLSWSQRHLYWYASLLRYAWTHFTAAARISLYLAMAGGVTLRAMIGTIQQRTAEPIRICAKVMRLICRYFLLPGGGGGKGRSGGRISDQAHIHVL